MVLMLIVASVLGYGIACGYLYYRKQQKIGLLEPPVDLLDEFKRSTPSNATDQSAAGDAAGENEPYTNRVRYTKAQARQRFKRGKT